MILVLSSAKWGSDLCFTIKHDAVVDKPGDPRKEKRLYVEYLITIVLRQETISVTKKKRTGGTKTKK